MTTRTLAVVSAGLSQPSSTRLLADRLSAAVVAAADGSVLVEQVELRPLARDLADHLATGFPSPTLEAALSTVTRADGLVAVTPVFSASYSGLFKTFFDVVEKDALAGLPTLLGATAGTARHSLVIDHAMRPLFAYLRAAVVPTGVFAATDDFGSAEHALAPRISRAADELVAAWGAAPARRDEDPEVTSFDQLLRQAGQA
ncbi:FMN reductase [Nocardioides marmoribigeumensis]|uniref:FMN reductase n=1 Tax=Nocardioides marmoribigeumensis TaxID=433649 RepID=A0ABU2BW80_9ACTN|nr:FMN reductase [Nocardioides marmoribigeumensis]MDR7362896.1 FMN reductase [Nocardioides marmoribigeumensis]